MSHSLESLNPEFLELFDDKLIYYQEISDDDIAVAQKFGFRFEGSQKNKGIQQGMKAAIQACQSDIVVYLENDCYLHPEASYARDLVKKTKEFIQNGALNVCRLRYYEPSEDQTSIDKSLKYWPDKNWTDKLSKKFWRVMRPFKAQRMIGKLTAYYDHPEKMFPEEINVIEPGIYRIMSKNLEWTNLAVMFRRDWFLNDLIPYAESHPTSRGVNGSPDLEKELNCRWWRKQNFKIGWVRPGIFAHRRLDRPEGDEKGSLNLYQPGQTNS